MQFIHSLMSLTKEEIDLIKAIIREKGSDIRTRLFLESLSLNVSLTDEITTNITSIFNCPYKFDIPKIYTKLNLIINTTKLTIVCHYHEVENKFCSNCAVKTAYIIAYLYLQTPLYKVTLLSYNKENFKVINHSHGRIPDINFTNITCLREYKYKDSKLRPIWLNLGCYDQLFSPQRFSKWCIEQTKASNVTQASRQRMIFIIQN